jgi:RND superfamily putative drug exporter
VVALLGLAAIPALDLRLALPDNSTAPPGTPARTTYDDITRTFGEGYNAPLVVIADIITSPSPQDTVSDLADAIRAIPGVVAVPQSTPDQGADTALIQVIPEGGQTDPATADLVTELRAQAPALEKKYAVSNMMVTGQTAANIDASDRLGGALLPFGAIVIGLSLILLTIVFRSIAVPLKATLGYLLSVGAALGAVVAIFQWGWADSVVPGLTQGPIVSFLPIFVMGVLFGLAMDYEMFLVSAMREDYVHTGDAHQAVYRGFKASSRVVTAAALIMVSVFTAFIPGGSSTIKPIAFGLAFGVFVDAFIVRMTFVPAVLVLLDRRAWWLPTWLDKRVPVVDVEGAALHRKIEFDDWEAAHGETTLLAKDLVLTDGADPVQFSVGPGVVNSLVVPDDATRLDLGLAMAGRRRTVSGELVVAGLLLPEQRELVSTTSTLIELDRGNLADNIDDQIEERARLASMSARRRRGYVQRTHDTVDQMRSVLDGEPTPVIRAAVVEAALAVQSGVRVIVLTGSEDLSERERDLAGALATDLAGRGLTVMLLERGSDDVRLADPPGRNLPGVLASSAVNAGHGAVHEEDPA